MSCYYFVHCSMKHYPVPRTILVDFEQAFISVIGATLDNDVQVRYCFYHLTQATWRKIQELVLVPQYRENDDFKLFCGQLYVIASLSTEYIPGVRYWYFPSCWYSTRCCRWSNHCSYEENSSSVTACLVECSQGHSG